MQNTSEEGSSDFVKNPIVFSHHAFERKTERQDWLVRTKRYGETRQRKDALSNLMIQKGRWYCRYDNDEKLLKFFCIVNKLEVYCGIYIDDEDIILITTYYSYTQKMKRRLFPRRKENFESIDITTFDSREYLRMNDEFNPSFDTGMD